MWILEDGEKKERHNIFHIFGMKYVRNSRHNFDIKRRRTGSNKNEKTFVFRKALAAKLYSTWEVLAGYT